VIDRLESLSKRERAEWLVALRAPVPPGLRLVHPSWLAHLTDEQRAAIDNPTTPTNVWLARAALAHIPPMLPSVVTHDLIAIGRAELAFALGRGPGEGSRRDAIKRAQGITGDDMGLARLGARTVRVTDRLAQLQLSRRYPKLYEIEAELVGSAR
jgi:hypothetical protein